ncbi:MAG: cation:proton antiporter [Thermoplasmata archaeon]
MTAETPLLGMLVVAFLLAIGLGWLCERIRVPGFVGGIIAGILIANVYVGPFSLLNALDLGNHHSANFEALTAFFEIGLIFLVFTVGMRIRPAVLRAVMRPALRTSLVGVAVPFALGAAFVLLAIGDQNPYAVLFIGTALAASSLGVVSQLLNDHQLVDRPVGHLLLGAAVFEDVIAFVLLAIIVALDGHNSSLSTDFGIQVALVIGLAIAFVVVFLFLAEPIVRRLLHPAGVPEHPDAAAKAGMLLLALLFCLAVGYLASSLQLAGILGAFFAGMALSEIAPLYGIDKAFDALNAFFVPFFFVFIGLTLSLTGLASIWLLAVLITVLALLGKLLAGLAEWNSLGRQGALSIGTGLMARGEVALIIAIAAQQAQLLSDSYLGAIVVMAIATTIVGPTLFRQVQRLVGPEPTSPSEPPAPPSSEPGPGTPVGPGQP